MERESKIEKPYEFFETPQQRQDLFECVKKASELLHDEEFSRLILIDRAARPAYAGIMEYWMKKYPDQKIPDIYFINPAGFKTPDGLEERFQEAYPKLASDKKARTLLLDTCVHRGNTLLPIKNLLDRMGFENFKIASANPVQKKDFQKINIDYTLSDKDLSRNCYPFGDNYRDTLLEKGKHVYSEPADYNKERKEKISREAARLREEVRRIVDENLDISENS